MHSVRTLADTDALSLALAEFIAAASKEAIENRGQFTIAWSGGSLPKLAASGLIANKSIDFTRWHVFFADERFVTLDHPDSNYLSVSNEFLRHVPIPANQVHPIVPTVSSVEECAQEYQQQVTTVLGEGATFDVILLGMGPDGHTASLFPNHSLLNENSLLVAPISDSPKPPPQRVTLTLPVLNRARQVAFVTAGEGKAEMLQKILQDPSANLPCQKVSGNVVWFVDRGAARLLANV
eukprot:c5881_g1_i1.p1 GENE.c5881_g1_i1~~c5881_g1_i1.p1  ORF type:complete len:237 (+),score=43.44 c5881_g1_i1:47-757(+)